MASIAFLGFHTTQFEDMRQHYADSLGLSIVFESEDQVWFSLDDGAMIHVYRSSDQWHAFFGSAPVPGIMVDDFDEVQRRLTSMNIHWLSDLQFNESRRWRHYRGPDGNVHEIMGNQ